MNPCGSLENDILGPACALSVVAASAQARKRRRLLLDRKRAENARSPKQIARDERNRQRRMTYARRKMVVASSGQAGCGGCSVVMGSSGALCKIVTVSKESIAKE